MSPILIAAIFMAGLGLLLGGILALASRKLAVEEDPRIDAVEEMLPHANCGACGFPGCEGLANALVSGEAKSPTLCKPSTPAHRDRITAFMETGIDPQASTHSH